MEQLKEVLTSTTTILGFVAASLGIIGTTFGIITAIFGKPKTKGDYLAHLSVSLTILYCIGTLSYSVAIAEVGITSNLTLWMVLGTGIFQITSVMVPTGSMTSTRVLSISIAVCIPIANLTLIAASRIIEYDIGAMIELDKKFVSLMDKEEQGLETVANAVVEHRNALIQFSKKDSETRSMLDDQSKMLDRVVSLVEKQHEARESLAKSGSDRLGPHGVRKQTAAH